MASGEGSPVDVVVVGGRVAGSLTALRLAERGATVRVLESRHFPSDTLSTHFFRGSGWQSPEEVGPEFSLVGDELAYVFPSDGDLACIALSITLAAHEAAHADPGGHLDARLRAHPSLADRVDGLSWQGGVFTGLPADSVLRRAAGPGWALVGDAGTGQDPWAGMGMDTAARQAEVFAEAFTEHPDDWVEPYAQLRAERTLAGYVDATRFAPDLRAMLDLSP